MQLALQHASTAARAGAPACSPGTQQVRGAPPAASRRWSAAALGRRRHQQRFATTTAAAAAAAPAPARQAGADGHSALLHGLGEVGEVSPVHMPWLLRLAHIRSTITGGDSSVALQESARGLLMWKVRSPARPPLLATSYSLPQPSFVWARCIV